MKTVPIENKKIIICSNIIWTITIFRKYLIKSLIHNNYKVYIISSSESFSENDKINLGDLDAEFINLKLDRSANNPIKDLFYFVRLFKIYRKIKPEVALHFTIKPNIYGSLVCRILKIHNINTINGLGSGLINNGPVQKIIKLMYRFSMKRSETVFFQNHDDLDYFIKNKIIRSDKADYMPGSGVNPDEYFLPVKQPDKKRVFIFVGRLIKDKGLHEYINAIKSLSPEFRERSEFLLAGIIDNSNPSGVTLEEIRNWESEKIISYIGKTDNIMDFFKLADFVVLPSYREGLSRLLLEAASCQKILIATNVPGCKEIVHDNVNGFLCNVKDSESLKNAFEKAILLDENSYSEFSQRSRSLVMASFTDKIVNEKYIKKITDISERKEKGS